MQAPEPRPRDVDVCVIGCGAVGSIAALVFARAGAKVMALEAGPLWEYRDFIPDELESYAFENRLGAKWNSEPVAWEDPGTGRVSTGLGLTMMNGVGGSAVHYAAHAWRFHPADFHLRSTVVSRYGEEAIPAESTIVDWPISYEDLEPFYRQVEDLIGVSGKAGVIQGDSGDTRICPGGNPFEGPRSAEFPMPPLRLHRLGSLVWDAAERLGYHPFMGPTSINSVDYRGRPQTNYCGFCLGYGCRIGAKGSPNAAVIPEAIWTGNVDIVPNATVIRLEPDENGRRLRSAWFVHNGTTREVRAKVFVLAAYTFENIRLLLASRSGAHPTGLSNRNGKVGRHLMVHRFDSVGLLFEDQYLNRFTGPQGQRVVIDDFNSDNFDHSGTGFIGGAQIFAPNEFHPIQDLGVIPPSRLGWGRAYKEFIKEYWNRIGLLMTNVEVLPYRGNYVTLDRTRVDGNGLPMMRAVLSMHSNENRLVDFIIGKMMEIGHEAGAVECWPLKTTMVPSQHDAGGTRMGTSAEDSVVDQWCRSHEVDNLLIVGPSVFPTASGLNPSLTAQALGWRAAENALQLL